MDINVRLSSKHLILLLIQVDKKNSIESSFNVYYFYNYYMVCTLLSHTHHVTPSCDITLTCDMVMVI